MVSVLFKGSFEVIKIFVLYCPIVNPVETNVAVTTEESPGNIVSDKVDNESQLVILTA